MYRLAIFLILSFLLLAGVGALLKHVTLPAILLLLALSVFVFAAARIEEKENLQRFGAAYRRYMEETRMFIPFLF